jgi:hypothetical protein
VLHGLPKPRLGLTVDKNKTATSMEMNESKVFKVPWNIWNNQNSVLAESAVEELVKEEEATMKRKLSESERTNLLDEITIFFTGNQFEDKAGKRQSILDDLRSEIRKMMVDYAMQRKVMFYISEESVIKRPVRNFSQVKSMWK